tara:strand:- start:41 stop:1024 length:984 start_codon:yes stop_codon:yes gene_type:complete
MIFSKIFKFFGYIFLILFNYIFICFTIYIVSAILLIKDIKPQNILIKEYQRNFYQKAGLMNIWQANPNCIEFDEKIIFRPKETTCEFNNLEFKTFLTFDENGRYSNNFRDITKRSIVVLGDSHAMGWGVNDNETFSYLLESEIDRPVYNLSISGFGTVRQLIRLKNSKLLENADTILIQYCFNDFGENKNFNVNISVQDAKEKFNLMQSITKLSFYQKLKKTLRYSATIPVDIISKKNKLTTFSYHKDQLLKNLKMFPEFNNKKIVVFYVNGFDMFFNDFPIGQSKEMENVTFYDVNLNESDFFQIDGHLNNQGHQKIASKLIKIIN